MAPSEYCNPHISCEINKSRDFNELTQVGWLRVQNATGKSLYLRPNTVVSSFQVANGR